MTNNNLTDERLSVLIRVARDSLELYEMELPVIDDVMLALAELQQLRAAMLQAGNSPVTPDGWISCSERMPDSKTAVLVAREFDRKGDWRMKWATYIPGHPDANDGWVIPGASWIPSHWMPLPEPPQEVNHG